MCLLMIIHISRWYLWLTVETQTFDENFPIFFLSFHLTLIPATRSSTRYHTLTASLSAPLSTSRTTTKMDPQASISKMSEPPAKQMTVLKHLPTNRDVIPPGLQGIKLVFPRAPEEIFICRRDTNCGLDRKLR